MQLPIIFNDRYQLIKKIGEGGLAEVYQAQDMALGRMVAVKVLREEYIRDPSFLVNFHREAQSAARLSDSHIVAVYDFGQDRNRPYIVLEWIPGSDLRDLIARQGKIPVNQVVEYSIQVCYAVGAAHRAGLVHGDLKPGNILITPNNIAKVTDFGLARALGESAMDEGEVVWGTPAYFSPEQAAGSQVLPATDVYAIGIIMYEMLTGRVPFVGVDDQEVARKQLYENHIPVDQLNPRVPEPVARIVDAAMAKNPNERFLTAEHLREALMMYKQGTLTPVGPEAPISAVVGSPLQAVGYGTSRPAPPPPSSPPSRRPKLSPPKKRRRFDYVIMILGIVAIFAIAGLIPLFVAAYNIYGPLILDEPATPLPTLQTNQIRVPDLIGQPEETARLTLENMGLTMTIEREEPHPTLPAFTIIQQSIPPGHGVEPGGVIRVVVSQGPSLVELPDVTGMPFEEAEQLLRSLGLEAQKHEDWSVETPGHVISQEPPPGSLIQNGAVVGLMVSSGSRAPVGAVLGGQILLTAYEFPRIQYRAGEAINLTFFWQAVAPISENYALFIHLTTPQGGIVSQIDAPPGIKPTGQWNVGEIVVDSRQLPIPPTTASGNYQIRVGFYNPATSARLPVLESGRAEQDNLGALILRSVQVVP